MRRTLLRGAAAGDLILLALLVPECFCSAVAARSQQDGSALLKDLGIWEIDPISARVEASTFVFPRATAKSSCLSCGSTTAAPAAASSGKAPLLKLLLATGNRALWYIPETQASQVLHEGGVSE